MGMRKDGTNVSTVLSVCDYATPYKSATADGCFKLRRETHPTNRVKFFIIHPDGRREPFRHDCANIGLEGVKRAFLKHPDIAPNVEIQKRNQANSEAKETERWRVYHAKRDARAVTTEDATVLRELIEGLPDGDDPRIKAARELLERLEWSLK